MEVNLFSLSAVIDEENTMCLDCLAGKQHRLPFPTSKSRAKKTGELIHADLWGPFEIQSLGGAKYFLLLKEIKIKRNSCQKLATL